MIPLRLDELADVVGGQLDDPADGGRVVTSVTIDSRQVGTGALFVALPGTRVDGHDYIDAAVAAGAVGFVHAEDRRPGARGGIAVDDPADALLGLGLWTRDESDPVVVAVTGSNGKTTTKDLIAATVGAGRSVVATSGSQNNELGLPLTCCRLQPSTEVLVTEIGMRGEGQIAALAGPLRPDIAVVTNVAGVHLELLGSLDAVARAKAELLDTLDDHEGVAILNADDPRVRAMAKGRRVAVITYGRRSDADVRAEDVELDADARARFVVRARGSSHRVALRVPGVHNVANALAAFAVALECGVDPEAAVAGLELAQVSPWRMQLTSTPDGVRILNDAYNANPDSTGAALRTLSAMTVEGRRVAVLGYMAEIGPTEHAAHAQVGRLAAELDLDGLVVVGRRAEALAAGAAEAGFAGALGLHRVDDVEAAAGVVAGLSRPGDVVLVKASRSAGLERVAAALSERVSRGETLTEPGDDDPDGRGSA